jgi:nitroimidazol reductase NimA-like FMN-containing flavoprotein (pyridoxamine 5'-phosphate oxidase superfamily)
MARKNPKICFEVDIDGEVYSSGPESCNWSCKYRSIISTGRMESPEKAEEMGIYASSEMDFSQVHKYTESDNNMMWFIADRP